MVVFVKKTSSGRVSLARVGEEGVSFRWSRSLVCADLCGRIRDLCGLRIIPVWSLSIPVWPQNYTCVL